MVLAAVGRRLRDRRPARAARLRPAGGASFARAGSLRGPRVRRRAGCLVLAPATRRAGTAHGEDGCGEPGEGAAIAMARPARNTTRGCSTRLCKRCGRRGKRPSRSRRTHTTGDPPPKYRGDLGGLLAPTSASGHATACFGHWPMCLPDRRAAGARGSHTGVPAGGRRRAACGGRPGLDRPAAGCRRERWTTTASPDVEPISPRGSPGRPCRAGACSVSRSGRPAAAPGPRVAADTADRRGVRCRRHLPPVEQARDRRCARQRRELGPARRAVQGLSERTSIALPRHRTLEGGRPPRRRSPAAGPFALRPDADDARRAVARPLPDAGVSAGPPRQRPATSPSSGALYPSRSTRSSTSRRAASPAIYHYAYREHALEQVGGRPSGPSSSRGSARSSSASAEPCCS